MKPGIKDEIYLREMAREYHARTEAYDRTVCTGPIGRGGITPATDRQRWLINRHAGQVYDELGMKARLLNFTQKQWQEAVVEESL